jgi:hypothetical protein
MNTFFNHKDIHKYTWYRDTLGQKSIIDFFISPSDLFSNIMDVCVKRGAELSTDHNLVVCTLRLEREHAQRHRHRKPAQAYRIRWEALGDELVKDKFANDIALKFRELPDLTSDVETEWELFRSAVLASAISNCGRKRLVVPTDSMKRTAWWNQEVKQAIRKKKLAYLAWVANKSDSARKVYNEAKRAAGAAVKCAKDRSWEDFGRRLDSNYGSANKVFWQTIRRLRGRKGGPVQSVKGLNGTLLTEEADILQRWRDYFEGLFNPITTANEANPEVEFREETSITMAEVSEAIKSLKSGKAPGEDEIRPEMLKALDQEGVGWLSRVCQVAWKSGVAPKQWQTGIVVPIYKKGDHRDCSNYRGISLLSLPGKVYAKCLEKRSRSIVEARLRDEQCGFRPGRNTMDQIFTLRQIFEKSWEFARELYACFIDLEKAYDRVPREKLWKVLQEYGVDGQLLTAIRSLYECPEFQVRVNGVVSTPFKVGVGLRQGCVLSPLLFITYMDWIDRRSLGAEGVIVGEKKVSHMLFADDLVLLGPSEDNLRQALESFEAATIEAGMRISVSKTEVLVLSRDASAAALHINGVPLKQVDRFKYLGVMFTDDGKQEAELDSRLGKASTVMRELNRSVVLKRELRTKAKLAVFKSVYLPTLTYGHECWIMSEKVRSRLQAAEMRFLRRVAGFTRLDRVRNTIIRDTLSTEPLLLQIERSQLRWYGHVCRMPHERLTWQIFNSRPQGVRPRGRPRTRWVDYVQNLAWSRLRTPPEELVSVASDRKTWKRLLKKLPPRPE